ncbi:DUF5677 domain-containing protein [Aliiroseovarius subalbicans]|uniref:DUF5677 domain-containing protein n=1 Tax=Aliiroseovarius subalbicans TaxID=2925840 RepID=UPI001F569E55|nr:DUF5677 domain-containing protein [Aliiroseovarius subalbicans]MCI2400379.1 DUF5677 domain-containing protein [Aliiroseovarius subalbicans]
MRTAEIDTDFTLPDVEGRILGAIDQLQNTKFDKQKFRHQIFVGLSASLLERCHAVVFLLKNGKGFDAKIILRSALEHLVELRNLCDFPDYHLHLQASFLRGIRTQLREATKGNPFFARIASELPIEDEIASTDKKMKEVEEMGGKALSITDKFNRTGMTHEYESVYRSLSLQVHPSYSGIIERHFDIDPSTGDFTVRGFQMPRDDGIAVLTDTTGQLVDHVVELLTRYGPALEPDF